VAQTRHEGRTEPRLLALALSTRRTTPTPLFGDALSLSKTLTSPRQRNRQVLGDGARRRCIRRARRRAAPATEVWEKALAGLDAAARPKIGMTVAKAMQEMNISVVGTGEFLSRTARSYFIEM